MWYDVNHVGEEMNKNAVVSLCLIGLLRSVGKAEESSVSISTAIPTSEVITSTAPPAEQAMTDRPGGGVFITLTRTAFPITQLPTSADIVTPERFEKVDAQNAGEAIAKETGIQTLPLGLLGSVLTAGLRGSPDAQVLVLQDGRPLSGVSLKSPDLSQIPVESIDHIEILRGGSSALYGANAVGGVINIITKRATYPGRPVSHVSYETRSFGAQVYRLNFGSRKGPADYFFYGNQQWESGFRDHSDARSYNVGGNFGLSMGHAGKFLFDASSYHINAGVPGFLSVAPNQFNNELEKMASSPNARQTTDVQYVRTSYLLPLPADMLLALRLFGSQKEVDFADPGPASPSSTDRNEQSKGGEVQWNLPLGLLAGGSFIRDREDNLDRLVSTNSFIRSVENWGVFLQENFRWNFLTLIPSGRYDHHSQFGDTLNPRVQLLADANPWLRFSGSAARAFRAPTIDDLYFTTPTNIANPNLLPEKAWTYDAGFEIHPDSHSLRVTYFRANVSNLIQSALVDPVNFVFATTNIGKARRQGMEIQIEDQFNAVVRNSINYTYLENLGVPPGFSDYVVLQFSPRHTLNDTLTLTPWKRWQFDSTWRFLDSRFSANNQIASTKLGSQVLWDLRAAYQLRQLRFYIGITDVADKRYVEQPGYPLPGRTYFGGLTLQLWD